MLDAAIVVLPAGEKYDKHAKQVIEVFNFIKSAYPSVEACNLPLLICQNRVSLKEGTHVIDPFGSFVWCCN
jgi:hypothetical protein